MRERIFILTLGLVLLLSGCSQPGGVAAWLRGPEVQKRAPEPEEMVTEAPAETEAPEETPVESSAPLAAWENIRLEDIPVSLRLLEPDESGQVYGELTFQNNTRETVVGFNLTAELSGQAPAAGQGEPAYFCSAAVTVPPGGTSYVLSTPGPRSGDPEDVVFVSQQVKLLQEDGAVLCLTYDCRTGELTDLSYDRSYVSSDSPQLPLTIEELELTHRIEQWENGDTATGYLTCLNRSGHTVTGLWVQMLNRADNTTLVYSADVTIPPGVTSAPLTAAVSSGTRQEETEPLVLRLTVEGEAGARTVITYDFRLDLYDVFTSEDGAAG